MLRGKLFHCLGAAVLNDRSPEVFNLASCTVSSSCPLEHKRPRALTMAQQTRNVRGCFAIACFIDY